MKSQRENIEALLSLLSPWDCWEIKNSIKFFEERIMPPWSVITLFSGLLSSNSHSFPLFLACIMNLLPGMLWHTLPINPTPLIRSGFCTQGALLDDTEPLESQRPACHKPHGFSFPCFANSSTCKIHGCLISQLIKANPFECVEN